MTRTAPKQKTYEELLVIAASAKRIDEDTFEFPSKSRKDHCWYVNVTLKTCRDLEGKGCPSLYYHGNCYHLSAAGLVLDLLRRFQTPNE